MGYWDCPKCAAENSLNATCCWRCGFQNYGAAPDAPPSPEQRGPLTDSVRKQREGIQAEIRKSAEDALERSRATLDRLARGRPEPGKKPDE